MLHLISKVCVWKLKSFWQRLKLRGRRWLDDPDALDAAVLFVGVPALALIIYLAVKE